MTMTDARLAAAVEAAARAHCRVYCGLTDDEPDIWDQHRPDVRDMHEADVEHIVTAALAAVDAWDREQGWLRMKLVQPEDWPSLGAAPLPTRPILGMSPLQHAARLIEGARIKEIATATEPFQPVVVELPDGTRITGTFHPEEPA